MGFPRHIAPPPKDGAIATLRRHRDVAPLIAAYKGRFGSPATPDFTSPDEIAGCTIMALCDKRPTGAAPR